VLAPITSILEVGCGSGVQAEMLLKAGIPYHGFDFNEIAVVTNPSGKYVTL
jgi:methylase of polypeptide subunit release factors